MTSERGMVLVTGGTGLLGSHLTPELLGRGCRVRVLVRQKSPLGGVEAVPGDVTEPASLERACAGVETVIHLVAVIREKGSYTFQAVNHQGTVNLVKAARQAGVRRFIQVGALGATGDPAYRYAHSKWQGEEAVRSSGISWAIVRPSVIYGRGFGFFNRLVQSLRLSPPFLAPMPGQGRALFQPVAAADMARCIARVLENHNFDGRIYEIGGPRQITYAGLLDALMKVLGVRRIKVPVPIPLMRMAVPIMGAVLSDPPVTPVELKQLELNNVTAADSIEKNFGFRPRDLEQGLWEIRDYLRSI